MDQFVSSRWLLPAFLAIVVFSCAPPDEEAFAFRGDFELGQLDSIILANYEITTLELEPDKRGENVATLLYRAAPEATGKAVLYVHGYGDYFFHDYLARWFNVMGFDFYALDLRKYGRSLLPHQRPNYTTDLSVYFEEIDKAVIQIKEKDGNDWLMLLGHSTGGLTTSLYCDEGPLRAEVDALLLNSPFFDVPGNRLARMGIGFFSWWGRWFPTTRMPVKSDGLYGRTLHADYDGEWDYTLAYKPIKGFPMYSGWMRAVRKGQKQVKQGLNIRCPVMVFTSHRSYFGDELNELAKESDTILDVDRMQELARGIGADVTVVPIKDAMHDVFLSRATPRYRALSDLDDWLEYKFDF